MEIIVQLVPIIQVILYITFFFTNKKKTGRLGFEMELTIPYKHCYSSLQFVQHSFKVQLKVCSWSQGVPPELVD